MTTLVAKLMAVENIPNFVDVDKEQELRILLDKARRDYPIVDMAAGREISFSDVMDRLHEKYKSWKLLLPRFRDVSYDEKLEKLRLDELIQADGLRTDSQQILCKEMGYYGSFLGWFYDKIANPVVAPLLIGGVLALASGGQGRFESEIANYSAFFGVGAFTGLIASLPAVLMRNQEISNSREQAKYLVAKINEVYRT